MKTIDRKEYLKNIIKPNHLIYAHIDHCDETTADVYFQFFVVPENTGDIAMDGTIYDATSKIAKIAGLEYDSESYSIHAKHIIYHDDDPQTEHDEFGDMIDIILEKLAEVLDYPKFQFVRYLLG